MREVRDTRAKFLLISRRDEQAWLGENLPARITIPPMPMWERVQLARAIAEKHGRRLTEVEDWRPLLDFTQGNPLTITVVVGQALRDGLRSKEQIEAFVERLRAGEAAFEDEVSEGRSKSLGASLNYGFEHAFSEEERKQLALLHFFQGFVNVGALQVMGGVEFDWCLPEVRGLTREAGIALLDRAAEIGLLTTIGDGYYTIHPALPWFFGSLFNQYHASAAEDGGGSRAARAFVEAMGNFGDFCFWEYTEGNRDVIGILVVEEENLLHARKLACVHDWLGSVISTMQGLHMLYDYMGRRTEWARLVDETAPMFVDPGTDGPLRGREEGWDFITGHRVILIEEARQWAEAERLQRSLLDWKYQRAAPALAAPPEALDIAQHNTIRNLAASLHELGEIQRELGEPDCVTAYEESLNLTERIGDRTSAATCAFNIGNAYMDISALRDLAQAEHWYRRSLELRNKRDRIERAKCSSQLGYVAYRRFREALSAKRCEEELLQHLNTALEFCQQALQMFPSNAVGSLAVPHNLLGNIYQDANDFGRALSHYREAIHYQEMQSDHYHAALTRYNVALVLKQTGRFADALDYAHAALRNFETYGESAVEMLQMTQEMIAQIEQAQHA